MKVFIFLTLLTLSLCVSFSSKTQRLKTDPQIDQKTSEPAITASSVADVNSKNVGWSATLYPEFTGKTQAELSKTLLGFIDPGPEVAQQLRAEYIPPPQTADLPYSFYAFSKWDKCKSIKMIRDQGGCGSCWAFASAEVISDRICIKKNNQDIVSPFHIVSCARDNGCGGGWMSEAFDFYISKGVVLDSCQPYNLSPKCVKTCTNKGYKGTYAGARRSGVKRYMLPNNEEEIKKEIYNNGPITAAFYVYNDFYSYKSGVYHKTSDNYAGGHAIKILGWGVENGVPFWYCANSWGTGWGMNGFFKILRGKNECSIEEWHVVAGLPK